MKRIYLAFMMFLLMFSVKAQDFKNFYTVENDGSVELDITNYDFHERLYTIYNIYDNNRFEVSEGKAYGLFKIVSNDDINAYLTTLHASFMELSKYDLDDLYNNVKNTLPKEFVTSLLFDISLQEAKSRNDNDHCVDSEPFCTSEIITFEASHSTDQAEDVPDKACLGATYNPSWYHMRINTPGQFIIHMEGVDPNNASIHRDIDYCIWGPFTDPTTPCVAQLNTAHVIDCSYSTSYSENVYLGYQNHSGHGHSSYNYHVPETGEYYILLITNYSCDPCVISFTKQTNSGPGTTDCSIIDPFLTANTPCVGSTLTLQADDIAEATYQWTGPDNQTHTGRTWNRTNATLSMAGTYTCHVTAGTQSGTETINAVVLPAIASVDFTYGTAIAGQEVQFTNSETTNPTGHNSQITSRTWNFGDGSTGNTMNPKHTYAQPGTYQVTYTATITGGDDGVCSNYITKPVVVQSSLSATIDGVSEICQNEEITLTVNINGGAGTLHYAWKLNNTPVGTNSPTLTYNMTSAGANRFLCEVSDDNTMVPAGKTVTVNALPNADAGRDQDINFDNATDLEALFIPGASYSWQPADSIVGDNNQRIIHTKNLKGSTNFVVTVTSGKGCVAQDNVLVRVGAEMTAEVSIADSEICEGESTTVTAIPTGGNPLSYSYSWEPADEVDYPNAASSPVHPSVNTNHFTCVISDGHTTLTKRVDITVHPLPIARADGDIHVNYGRSAELWAEEVEGASYEWLPKDMIQNGDNEHQRVTTVPLTEETEFTLIVTRNGCSTEDTHTVFAGNQLQGKVETTDNSICQYVGETQLTATAFGGEGEGSYQYTWTSSKPGTFSDPSSATTAFSNPEEAGVYVLKCEIFDGETNIERSTTINVVAQPNAGIAMVNPNIINGYPSVVEGSQITLMADPVDNATYSWTPAELIMSVSADGRTATTYPLNQVGLQGFTVEVNIQTSTNNYCVNSASLEVNVYENVSASFIEPQDNEICEHECLTLSVNALGGTGEYNYTWEPVELFDNNTGRTVTTKELSYNNGMITFSCTVEDRYLENANQLINKEIIIHDKPRVSYDLLGEKLVEAGNEFYPFVYEYSIDTMSMSGYNISEISWEITSEYDTPNQMDPMTHESMWLCVPDPNPTVPGQPKKAYVYVTEEGNARLTCTITGECGYATSRIIIYTDGYEYNDFSVKEINYNDLISVYPNPNNGELYINFGAELSSAVTIGIYDYSGAQQMQFTESMMSNVTHYSINGLADGMYFVRIVGKDFAVTKKIVLSK